MMMMMMIWCLFLSPSFYYGGSSCSRWYSSSNFVKDSPWVSILSLKVSKAESGGGGIQCNMTVLFHDMYIIHCTIMRMVFKSRVCVCQLISQLQQNIYACRFSRKRKIQIPQEMPPCSMYDFTLVCMHLSC